MKKILCIALCALTVFALAACDSKAGGTDKDEGKQPPVLTGTWADASWTGLFLKWFPSWPV